MNTYITIELALLRELQAVDAVVEYVHSSTGFNLLAVEIEVAKPNIGTVTVNILPILNGDLMDAIEQEIKEQEVCSMSRIG